MRDDPIIYAGPAVQMPKSHRSGFKPSPSTQNPSATEQKGYLLIRDLWQKGTNSVHDMYVANTDAKSYVKKTPERCLQDCEKAKKKVYLEDCLQKRQHFLPFVASVGGLLDVEAEAALKGVSKRLATKWQQPYSRTCGYVNSRIAITRV